MSSLVSLLNRVTRDLLALDVEWAVIGGMAIGARVVPRFTRDLDLAVIASDDDHAERIIHGLHARGYQIAAVLEQASTGRLATVRLLPAGDERLVDLLFASSGIETQIVKQAEPLDVGENTIAPVATIGHLLAMKTLARNDDLRPQDRLDLIGLLKVAKDADLNSAREALEQIRRAGLHRKRDLLFEFETLLREQIPSDS